MVSRLSPNNNKHLRRLYRLILTKRIVLFNYDKFLVNFTQFLLHTCKKCKKIIIGTMYVH